MAARKRRKPNYRRVLTPENLVFGHYVAQVDVDWSDGPDGLSITAYSADNERANISDSDCHRLFPEAGETLARLLRWRGFDRQGIKASMRHDALIAAEQCCALRPTPALMDSRMRFQNVTLCGSVPDDRQPDWGDLGARFYGNLCDVDTVGAGVAKLRAELDAHYPDGAAHALLFLRNMIDEDDLHDYDDVAAALPHAVRRRLDEYDAAVRRVQEATAAFRAARARMTAVVDAWLARREPALAKLAQETIGAFFAGASK